MTRRILTGVFCLFTLAAQSQVLRDLNYNYQYDPNGLFTFTWKVLKVKTGYKVFYELTPNDTTQTLKDLTIQLETRESLNVKNGIEIPNPTTSSLRRSLVGSAEFNAAENQQILVAKVTWSKPEKPKVYTFHKRLPKAESLYLTSAERAVQNSFINLEKSVMVSGLESDKPLQFAYYSVTFPPGAPAFSMTQAKVSKAIKPDSTFIVNAAASLTFAKKGLYLVQYDTSSAEGVAFRVEADYPKLGKLESLAGPLVYICTKQETEKLKQAGNDKKKFDHTILSITGNPERARTFMRNYFKRVESANLYFTSYKEGWKTDRGMIYIIFGEPEEVYLFEDKEVWEYENDGTKTRFQFIKSPTLFDRDNYVLVRDKKYSDRWYKMVDLLRKARF